jgi:hypothetical protein
LPRSYSINRQFLLYAGLGTAEWLGLVAIEGRYDANWLGDPYLVALVITALMLGAVNPRMPHLRAGILLIAPALVLALWTAPHGNNDGLWMLWFPILFFFIFFVAGCHGVGAKIRTR